MVRQRLLKFCLICFLVQVVNLAHALTSFTPSSLPPSEFADTESSSNFVFNTGTDCERNWILSLQADVANNNNIQIEFGVDKDLNGVLSVNEREVIVGWDCGKWIVKDRRNGFDRQEMSLEGKRKFVLRLCLNKDQNASDSSGVLQDFDITRLFNPAWNMARVVVRGCSHHNESIKSVIFPQPFVLRVL